MLPGSECTVQYVYLCTSTTPPQTILAVSPLSRRRPGLSFRHVESTASVAAGLLESFASSVDALWGPYSCQGNMTAKPNGVMLPSPPGRWTARSLAPSDARRLSWITGFQIGHIHWETCSLHCYSAPEAAASGDARPRLHSESPQGLCGSKGTRNGTAWRHDVATASCGQGTRADTRAGKVGTRS